MRLVQFSILVSKTLQSPGAACGTRWQELLPANSCLFWFIPACTCFTHHDRAEKRKNAEKKGRQKREKRECCPVYSLFLSPYLLNEMIRVYLSPISPNTILLTKILFSIQRLVPFLNDLGTWVHSFRQRVASSPSSLVQFSVQFGSWVHWFGCLSRSSVVVQLVKCCSLVL